MKEFEFTQNLYAALKSLTLVSQATHFKLLDSFGFKVDEVNIRLFSGDTLVHFHEFCFNEPGALIEVEPVNALSFYENVLKTNDVSSYCDFCVRKTVLSSGDTAVWGLKSSWLPNMVLYANEPITDIRFFHTVSLALYQFKKAVNVLKPIFGSKDSNWFEQVIEIQSRRLKTAREFFVKDEMFLISELSKMVTDSETLNVLNTNEFSGSLSVCPWDIFAFDFIADAKFRSTPDFSVENKILDVLELLFLNSFEKFLVAPDVFLKLWQYVTLNSFKLTFPIVSVPVPVSFRDEFMETFTVLTKDEVFISDSFYEDNAPFSFSTTKICSFVEVSKDLVLS